MELSNIPQILDLLVQNEVITADQQSMVLQDLDDAKNQKKSFLPVKQLFKEDSAHKKY